MIKIREVSKLIRKNQFNLLILISLYVFLGFLSRFPYLNVILSSTAVFMVLFFTTIYLFKLGQSHFSAIALFILPIAVFASVFDLPVLAEEVGNLLYVLISLWLVFSLVEYFKSFKK